MPNRVALGLLVLLALPCLLTALPGVRSRRKVHKRARPPEGGPLSDGISGEDERLRQYLNVRKRLQLIFSPPNATGHEQNPELDWRANDPAGELVDLKTLERDKDWIEAQFVNESLQTPPHVHHARPYGFKDWVLVLLPMSVFLVPFLVWLSCITCIFRAPARKGY